MSIALDTYVTLGRSGLRVSPICLGQQAFRESRYVLELAMVAARSADDQKTGVAICRASEVSAPDPDQLFMRAAFVEIARHAYHGGSPFWIV